jgi:hypothetical protein
LPRPQHLGVGGFDDHAAPAPVMKSLSFIGRFPVEDGNETHFLAIRMEHFVFSVFFFRSSLLTGWWFETFFIFTNSWDDDPI